MGCEEHVGKRKIAVIIILGIVLGSMTPSLAAIDQVEEGYIADEELQEIIWQGDVALTNGTTINVTAYTSGEVHEVASATAFGALAAAAAAGSFNYTVSDDWGFLFVDSIADVPNEGWSGWMYWVNYPEEPMPMVGATDCVVEEGDVVTWYWSSSMEMTPADSPRLVLITVTITDDPAPPTPYPTLDPPPDSTPDPAPEPTPTPPLHRSGRGGKPRDSDHDGHSDIEELLAGTDPNDQDSYPGKPAATPTPTPGSTPRSTPKPTPKSTAAPTPIPTPNAPLPHTAADMPTLEAPGFEAVISLIGLLAVGFLVLRREKWKE